tara:strand:+ start:7723 stop:8190 length:468 start_codon:yes stop_codon:yes gene_type:complete
MATASYVSKWLEINGTPKEIEDIVGYCLRKENGKVFKGMDKDTITTMVTYHMFKKTISVIYEDKKVVGVHMWYNCDYTDDWTFVENWEEDKKDGDTIWLAFLFGDSNEVMKELILDFIKKEPDVLTKKLVAIREKQNIPTRIDVSRKYFSKILKK